MKAFSLFCSAFLLLLAAAPTQAAYRVEEDDFVQILGDKLFVNGQATYFSCASGVRLPALSPNATLEARSNAVLQVQSLATNLATNGFNMVRLTELKVPQGSSGSDDARSALFDEFIAACKKNGVYIWAEVQHPISYPPPTAEEVGILDDPSSADDWRTAVTNTSPWDLTLTYPWDPRSEILLQKRIRSWALAFNPKTGLRRCDDPAFALFSFTSLWWDEFLSPNRPPLQSFFKSELGEMWNSWLFNRFQTMDKLVKAIGPLAEGERFDDEESSVAFLDLREKAAPEHKKRHTEQGLFLHNLYLAHMKRILDPFSACGATTRSAPHYVVNKQSGAPLSKLSTIDYTLASPEELKTPFLASLRKAPAPSAEIPRIYDASMAYAAAESEKRPDSLIQMNPPHAAAAVYEAAARNASILVLPCGNSPQNYATSAFSFRAVGALTNKCELLSSGYFNSQAPMLETPTFAIGHFVPESANYAYYLPTLDFTINVKISSPIDATATATDSATIETNAVQKVSSPNKIALLPSSLTGPNSKEHFSLPKDPSSVRSLTLTPDIKTEDPTSIIVEYRIFKAPEPPYFAAECKAVERH